MDEGGRLSLSTFINPCPASTSGSVCEPLPRPPPPTLKSKVDTLFREKSLKNAMFYCFYQTPPLASSLHTFRTKLKINVNSFIVVLPEPTYFDRSRSD